jgi:hypothetical protein
MTRDLDLTPSREPMRPHGKPRRMRDETGRRPRPRDVRALALLIATATAPTTT